MKPGRRAMALGALLLGAAALGWWRWGEALFLAGLGAPMC